MSVAIKLENISKQYRLGQVGTGTISHDLNRWWHRVRGKEDPYSQVGQINRRDQAAESEYVWALKDINLEVEQGEVLGIIGANGAGKSTLLKLISRITSPTTGAIKAKGRIASLLEVGTGMHPEMTARENIYLNGSILGMRRHEITKKFDDIVDFAGCRMYVDTPVKRYSSGMRVRLGFAVAAFLEPQILIVDEVLAVGDAEFQKRAIGKMQEVARGGRRTVLFVSHNMTAVSALCHSAVVLAEGTTLIRTNTPEAVSRYIALSQRRQQNGDNLLELAERSGNGTVRLAAFWVEDCNGNKIDCVPCGSDAVFVFSLKTYPEKSFYEGLQVGFSIHNSGELSTLSILYSGYQNEYFCGNGECLIKCHIPRLSLAPAEYPIGCRVLVNNEESDWIKGPIGSVSIVESDFYNTGQTPRWGNAPLYMKGNWNQEHRHAELPTS